MKRITASSSDAFDFGELYDVGDDKLDSRIYDQINEILDKYGSDQELVTETFDKASDEDKAKLLELAGQLSTLTIRDIRIKYDGLVQKERRSGLSEVERMYLKGLRDMAYATGTNLNGI